MSWLNAIRKNTLWGEHDKTKNIEGGKQWT